MGDKAETWEVLVMVQTVTGAGGCTPVPVLLVAIDVPG